MGGEQQQDVADQHEPQLARRSVSLRGVLVRYFRQRLPGATDVEDLVQEVFLRIVRRGDNEDLDRFEGYVFQTAASVIKDRFRRRRTRAADRHVTFRPNDHGETEIDPERVVIGQEALAAVAHRIMALPERTRTIFVLRRLEGMSVPDIARQLGLSLSTVEKHIQRAARQVLSGDEYRS